MIRRYALPLIAAAAASIPAPIFAKDSLGVFANWAAFRDANVMRCYAIAKPEPSNLSREYEPFASVGSWPKRNIRGQLHIRLSREMAENSSITLIINSRRFALTGGGGDAWARDQAMDAAIVAAMRSGSRMIVSAVDKSGKRFSNTYDLSGSATAMDAATVGCARN